jgi:hypothetical protein
VREATPRSFPSRHLDKHRAHSLTGARPGHTGRRATLPPCRAQRRSGAKTPPFGGRATTRWLIPGPFGPVRDDAGRHNDTSRKGPPRDGGGRGACAVGINRTGPLCEGQQSLRPGVSPASGARGQIGCAQTGMAHRRAWPQNEPDPIFMTHRLAVLPLRAV